MAVITFMSDFGLSDHYVAAIKARVLQTNHQIRVIDLSHEINYFDIAHAAYLLRQVYKDFPDGTIHLVCVDAADKAPGKYLAAKLGEHYFVCPDNGLISLLEDSGNVHVIDINTVLNIQSTFPAKDIMAPVAAKLANGQNFYELGPPCESYKRLINRQVKATKKEIVGHVIRVDHYGNLITNIEQSEFEAIHKMNKDSSFSLRAGREQFNKIHQYFNQVDPGDCYLIFNSNGLLQIGINKGNASELLGLHQDTPIFIQFKTS